MFNWQGFEGQVPFTDLLGYVPSDTTPPPPPTQAPTEPGGSQWFAEASTSAQVRIQSAGHTRDSQAWYDHGYMGGSTYTFRTMATQDTYDGPALAAGARITQPPDNYTPDDFVRRQCDRGRARGRGRGRGRRGT